MVHRIIQIMTILTGIACLMSLQMTLVNQRKNMQITVTVLAQMDSMLRKL